MDIQLPEFFDTYSEAKKNGFLRLKEAKEKGKKVVGVFCSYTPVELIRAAGAASVGLCGSSEDGIAQAEAYLPQTLCPLIKSSFGQAHEDLCPFFYFSDAIIGETTCDGKKKMFELLGEFKPVHVMHLPQMQDQEEAVLLWTAEMHRAARFIEEKLDTKITEDNLRKAIKESNEIRRAILEFYELGQLNPVPVPGSQITGAAESMSFCFEDEDIAEILRKKAAHYRSLYNPDAPKKPRILLTGCPLGGSREKILGLMEKQGADMVALDSCAGPRTQKMLVREDIDPYRALAEKYLNINCSVMTPNKGRFEDLEDIIRDYQVDGVVEVILHGCHTFATEAYYTKKFADAHNLPYLLIDTDYSQTDYAQIETRMGAFIEMLSE